MEQQQHKHINQMWHWPHSKFRCQRTRRRSKTHIARYTVRIYCCVVSLSYLTFNPPQSLTPHVRCSWWVDNWHTTLLFLNTGIIITTSSTACERGVDWMKYFKHTYHPSIYTIREFHHSNASSTTLLLPWRTPPHHSFILLFSKGYMCRFCTFYLWIG